MAVAINGHMFNWLAKTDGEDGAFLKANTHPAGGNCFVLTTAGGTKLAGANGPGGAAEALSKGLAAWRRLPEAKRKALPKGTPAAPPQVALCTPPTDGLVVKVYTRNLKQDRAGYARIRPVDLRDRVAYPDWQPIHTEPVRYNLWLTNQEWRSLVPETPEKGQRFPVPEGIQKRVIRYHLVNGTFGLPGVWKKDEIRHAELTLTVEEVGPVLRMRLDGVVLLTSVKETRGYDARLLGNLEYDPRKKAFTRFDAVAVGDYWGGDYEGGRFLRPGRSPLGFAFELARGDTAVDRAPPRVHMDFQSDYDRYFAAERLD